MNDELKKRHLKELKNFGLSVFNNENEKIERWLSKPNYSLNNSIPNSLLDNFEGTEQVKRALNRIEYGNMS
ncbi:DUF2384 domain-containing protein [Kriegella sp. EG-1]|nr:DUF2384 domain-containing protein [Flavobacteriaceae bacterium EG-1]